MEKKKLTYLLGSIIIGLVSVVGIFFALIALGVIGAAPVKLVLMSASGQKEYIPARQCYNDNIAQKQKPKGVFYYGKQPIHW